VAEEALGTNKPDAARKFNTLYHDVMWIDRTRESEYDTRRLLANEGIATLENALSSVGDRREAHGFSSPGHGSLSYFNDVKEFKADTDEEAIVGMHHLIQGHVDTERQKWETIAAMKTSDGTPLLHVRGPQFREFRWRYHDALENQYAWQVRQEGFNLGLQASAISSTESVESFFFVSSFAYDTNAEKYASIGVSTV
jgi:hypothetical protein